MIRIYEYPEFTMPENYAFIINSMLLTAFYSPLLPIALFYTLICLFLAYWIYKVQFLYYKLVPIAKKKNRQICFGSVTFSIYDRSVRTIFACFLRNNMILF